MKRSIDSRGMAKRAGAIAAGAILAAMCATPAFAENASVDASSGVGTTDL